MPALQVKDCPDELYERLRICANEQNRSISQQTVTILEEYLGMRPASKPAVPTAPLMPEAGRPRLLYSIGNRQDDVDYISRRARIFEEIAQLPQIPITETAPRTDVILAQIREEEAR